MRVNFLLKSCCIDINLFAFPGFTLWNTNNFTMVIKFVDIGAINHDTYDIFNALYYAIRTNNFEIV